MTRTIVHGDPTPQLTKHIEADMEASALDAFIQTGNCSKELLRTRYGFQPHQLEAYGDLAIFKARHTWIEQKAAGEAA